MAAYTCFADVYDKLTSNIDYKELAEYYNGVIEKHGGKKGILLDLACGTGSLSVELDRLGYDVIGADLSPEMLSVAKEKPHENIEYLCQDMCELDMFGTIDVCVCSLDSINHLESEDDIKSCFSSVSLFTEKGGLFVFDINTVTKHREVLGDNTFVYDLDDVYCVWQNYYCEDDRVDICLDIFIRQEDDTYERCLEEFSEIALPIDRVQRLLIETGFEVVAVYDYMTENDGDDNSEKVLICAKKK